MNFIIGGILLFICAFCGLRVADSYRKKLYFAQDFGLLLDLIETNLLFMQDDLKNFLESKKDGFHKDFSAFLDGFTQNLSDSSLYLQTWVAEERVTTKECAELLANFMQSLGRNDSATQLQTIKQTREILQAQLLKIQEEQKKGHLYSRLGVMGGLALFIIVL